VSQFFYMLDHEAVELYQWLFYVVIAFDGIQNLVIAHGPPLTLQGVMKVHPYFEWWCMLEIVAPISAVIGRAMARHADDDFKELADQFQMAGDAILGSSEVAYVVGTFQIEPIGKGGHGGYLGFAFFLSAYLLALADFRRLRRRRHWRAHAGEICLKAYRDAIDSHDESR
jgi:hypothetical protein